MAEERQFPIHSGSRREMPGMPNTVRWDALNELQARKNHGQTLERLAERGGLSPTEMMCNVARIGLYGINYRQITVEEQMNFINTLEQ